MKDQMQCDDRNQARIICANSDSIFVIKFSLLFTVELLSINYVFMLLCLSDYQSFIWTPEGTILNSNSLSIELRSFSLLQIKIISNWCKVTLFHILTKSEAGFLHQRLESWFKAQVQIKRQKWVRDRKLQCFCVNRKTSDTHFSE